MFIRYVLFIFALLILQVSAQAETCLDYWRVGPNGDCRKPTYERQPTEKPKTEEPKKVEEPKSQPQVQEQPQENLDTRIDDYLENYEKPPREYAAFHLEPTLENAIKWVKKYRETIDRSRKLAEAWSQAEYLYDHMQAQGVDVNNLVELENELPDVQGFIKDIQEEDGPGLTYRQDLESGKIRTPEKKDPNDSFRIGASKSSSNQEMTDARYQGEKLNAEIIQYLTEAGVDPNQLDFIRSKIQGAEQDTGRLGGFSGSATADGSMRVGGGAQPTSRKDRIGGAKPEVQIEYFYSARCPFCRKFEPIFQRILSEQRDHFTVNMTCSDITPSLQGGKETADSLGCTWRGVTDDAEIDQKRIEQTPTLLITWPNGQNQRVEGLIDYQSLSQYFNSQK